MSPLSLCYRQLVCTVAVPHVAVPRAAAATALGAGTLGAGSAGSAAHSWLRSAVNVCCLRILQSIGFAGIVFCWLEVKLKHYIFNS